MLLLEEEFMSLRSMIIWQDATASGTVPSLNFSVFLLTALISTNPILRKEEKHMLPISLMERIMNSDLITCVTIWLALQKTWCSAGIIMPSLMKLTLY